MNLEKAIEINKLLARQSKGALHPDTQDALKLGIEALKRINTDREGIITFPDEMLPGETTE